VADVRHDPDPASEQVTQALLNVPVECDEVAGDWTHVRLVDYSGWIRSSELEAPIVHGFCEGGSGTCGVPLPYSLVVTATHAPVYLHETGNETIAEAYLSTVLPFIDLAHEQRLHVALPGERDGWIPRSCVDVRKNDALFPQQDMQVITDYARAFLEIPYLWGGVSWRGIDCSGFVQLCYRMAGDILPRDADQQHDFLTQSVSREDMQTGDLIFFGEQRITHVALALNNHEYIHAAGGDNRRVIISSFDPQHAAYSARLDGRFWGIKRVR